MHSAYDVHYFKKHQTTEKCCDYDFTGDTKGEKRKHFRIVHQGFIACSENKDCPVVFKSIEALKEHAKLHQSTKDQCDKCDFTTPFPKYLRLHMEKMHNKDKVEKFECVECNNKEFHTKKGLSSHKLDVHTVKECKLCEKTIKGSRNLQTHIKRFHYAEENKKFYCDRCGKRFFDRTHLGHHMDSIHLGVVFYCRYPICDKKLQPYRNTGNRDAHERKRHGQNYNVFLKQNLASVNKS